MAKVTSKDGTSIGYETVGEGPLVVFVLGATQYRGVDQSTPRLAQMLAESFTALLYDRRGRGESGNTEPFAVAREVEDIAALIEANGGKASLVGFSSGAVLAIEATAALGDRVERVIAYEPPINPAEPLEVARAELEAMEALKARGDGEAAMVRFMSTVGMPPEQLEGFKASPAWPAFTAVGTTIAHDLRAVFEGRETGMPSRWRSATQPALIVNGDRSYPFMAESADAIAEALPDGRRVTLAGEDHGPRPEALAPIIRDFLS